MIDPRTCITNRVNYMSSSEWNRVLYKFGRCQHREAITAAVHSDSSYSVAQKQTHTLVRALSHWHTHTHTHITHKASDTLIYTRFNHTLSR